MTNVAAYNLYHKVLGYSVKEIKKDFYNDDEDAYFMVLEFGKENEEAKASGNGPEGKMNPND